MGKYIFEWGENRETSYDARERLRKNVGGWADAAIFNQITKKGYIEVPDDAAELKSGSVKFKLSR